MIETQPKRIDIDEWQAEDGTTPIVDVLREDSYVFLGLDEQQQLAIDALKAAADTFFAKTSTEKKRYLSPDADIGYRDFEAAISMGLPDANDSFVYWTPRTIRRIPHYREIPEFLAAFEHYRQKVIVPIAGKIFLELTRFYAPTTQARQEAIGLPFQESSPNQVNSYSRKLARALLQAPHEDGAYFTPIWTSSPGLELLPDGLPANGEQPKHVVPISFDGPNADTLLVMAGEPLAIATGGDIRPGIHRASNHGDTNRKVLAAFVSPDTNKGIVPPYVSNEYNGFIKDMVPTILGATDQFNIAPNFAAGGTKSVDIDLFRETMESNG